MKRSISDNLKAYVCGLVLLLLLWQLLAVMIGETTMVFPGPVQTVRYVIYLLGREYTYRCIAATMTKMLTGFAISLVLGFIAGVVAGNHPFIEKMLSPLITTLRAVPTASLVYLFIVLAGFRLAPMYLVVMISFPIIYEGVTGGIKSTPVDLLNASDSDGASPLAQNLRIRIPLAMPYIVIAMASAFSLCFKIEIMAEVITGSSGAGLGSAILGVRSSDPTNMVPVFGYSTIAVMMMLAIDYLSMTIRNKTDIN